MSTPRLDVLGGAFRESHDDPVLWRSLARTSLLDSTHERGGRGDKLTPGVDKPTRGQYAIGVVVIVILSLVTYWWLTHQEKGEADPPPALPFASARVHLIAGADTVRLLAELAESQDQHTLGLMERHHLADSAGMLFLYPDEQPASAGYWMFRTRIPLDIAFLDSVGTIRSIQHMVPCPTDFAQGCPSYPPGVSYRAALEVNAGYFAQHKLDLGSRVVLGDTGRHIPPAVVR
jgi:uncharacterized protein